MTYSKDITNLLFGFCRKLTSLEVMTLLWQINQDIRKYSFYWSFPWYFQIPNLVVITRHILKLNRYPCNKTQKKSSIWKTIGLCLEHVIILENLNWNKTRKTISLLLLAGYLVIIGNWSRKNYTSYILKIPKFLQWQSNVIYFVNTFH